MYNISTLLLTLKHMEDNQIFDLYNSLWEKGIVWETRLEQVNSDTGRDFQSVRQLNNFIRGIKRKRGYYKKDNVFKDSLEENWFDWDSWKHWWLKVDGKSIFVKNDIQFDPKKAVDDIMQKIKDNALHFETIEYERKEDWYCLLIDPSDHHFWKFSNWEETWSPYNLEIAKERFKEGIAWLVDKAKWFEIDQIIFQGGNDILHVDNPFRKTTKWTPQDTDGNWDQAFDIALTCYIQWLQYLSEIAPVHVKHDISNHDQMSGYMLMKALEAYFHNNSNITFDVSTKPRKYTLYGKCLLGSTHGDWIKEEKLWPLMATEEPEGWYKSNFRYFILHHMHHKISKDQIGVTVEYMRSASGTDSWHASNGYIWNPAMDALVFSKENGMVARFTHFFKK